MSGPNKNLESDPKFTSWLINRANNADGTGTFGIGKVIGRNDGDNQGGVIILKVFFDSDNASDLEHKQNIETKTVAEPLKLSAGENHGVYYTPEYGDYVLYTELGGRTYIIGAINHIGHKYAGTNIPPEAQHIEQNSFEYNSTHYPDLTRKGYHLAPTRRHENFHPASFLTRWRRNDILMLNTQKMSGLDHATAKLMEFRSAENQMLQLVDIGNFNIKAGLVGNNNKKYAANRQTDYRDLWEGFNINKEFWTQRTDKPPLTHESQYIKLATNGHDYSETPHNDTGADLPDLIRGAERADDRQVEGSHETSKTYCPVWQTLCYDIGSDRYYEDKPPLSPWAASVPFRFKLKKWIEDTSDAYNPEVQHFNVGHYLTLSNTIFKRRAMLSTKKGHQLVMSDIDLDEKVLLNSHRGKHIYMEDGMPDLYNVMWNASEKHHHIFCDHQAAPYLIDDQGAERHRLLDPNQLCGSTYQLIQTEKYQKIWLSDSPLCPRIHAHTTDGHELLLLDHDMGVASISPTPHKGKIQITTSDKQMQITLDVESGNLTIQNHNPGGLDIYSLGDLSIKTNGMMTMEADLGFRVNSSDGMWIETTNQNITNSEGPYGPAAPTNIRPTVLTNIDVTEGTLINKFDPS